VHSVLGMVSGAGCAQRPACVFFQCGCMRATQWCPLWDGAVRGAALGPWTWGCGGGWVRAQCVGHGVKCRLRAAPRLCVFPVLLHAGYLVVCMVGWCGEWGCARTVDMVVREVGVMGRCVHSVWGMVRGAGCTQRPAHIVF
jgi:hypothetical protein